MLTLESPIAAPQDTGDVALNCDVNGTLAVNKIHINQRILSRYPNEFTQNA